MITKKYKIPSVIILGIFIVGFALTLSAREIPKKYGDAMLIQKPAADKYARTLSNISNLSYWLYYDGKSAIDPNGNSGGVYPRATTGVVFTDGIVWGGYVTGDTTGGRPELRVGGQTYNIGTTPGWIITPGNAATGDTAVAVSADDPRARIYRVRQDYRNLSSVDKDGKVVFDPSVLQDAAEVNFISRDNVTEEMQQGVVDQYATDWKEWPVDLGAPYYDEDGNGEYNPVLDGNGYPIIGEWDATTKSYSKYYDRPGLAGADQVVWFVVNDLNESRTLKLYGAPPIGIELQITVWAYNQPNSTLGQMLFKKFKFINKSGYNIDSMFVSQWADPDIGNYTDDLAGCDVDLSMGFAYSGYRTDAQFDPFGLPPAAVGYDFFQGPMVDGQAGQDLNNNGIDDAEDYAVFNLQVRGPGKINLPMTSFLYFAAGSPISDPDLGEYDSSKEWYNMLNGYQPTTDLANPTPYTVGNDPDADPTKYPLSGDPFLGSGDVDGVGKNLPPGDRRIGMASGPFYMAPLDTQEVVVAVVGGIITQEGGDNRNAVAQLKLNDAYAQFLYNNLFKGVPAPPTKPNVSVTQLENKISLNWGFDEQRISETERDDPLLGFDFEGYNVYQLPSATASKEQAKLIATYDKDNFVQIIRAEKFLPSFGDVVEVPIQYGKDYGVKRSITVDQDYVNERPLYNGQTYYFAVTAYNYNPDPNVPEQSLESELTPISVIPQSPNPGYEFGSEPEEDVEYEHSSGAAEQVNVSVQVVEPAKITGDDYKIDFEYWHFYMDTTGEWKRTNYPDSIGKKLSKIGDVSPSTISAISYTSPNVGTRDLRFILDLVSPDYNYAEGVELTFPPDITINSAEGPEGITALIDEDANTVLFGNAVHDSTDLTGAGAFAGGEMMVVNVNTPTLPLDVDYLIYDDGWATLYCADPDNAEDCEAYGIADAVVVNAEGTCTITESGYAFKTVPVWNLTDVTTNEVILAGQEKLYNEPSDMVAAPIVDGFQIIVGGGYDVPIDFSDVIYTDLAGEESSVGDLGGDQVDVSSYHYSGWENDAYATTTRGQGTSDLLELIKDYEIRWTGEFDTVTVGDQVLMNVKEGTGSMARLYGSRNFDLADHPMNPNPGSSEPFMVRVPFEVWNVDDDQQINFDMFDRIQDFTTADTVWAFNPYDRMYCEFVNTPYKETLYTEDDLDQMTWNLVFWEAPYVNGEKLYVKYPNPILIGIDEFTFSTADMGISYEETKAKADVAKINVFPNPYYAYNPAEANRFERFVTFNHLPPKVTVRIFDLSGVQVRKLTEEDKLGGVNSEFIRWNLRNESDIPVASGMYIVHIDMPDLDKTKVLKVFIIQAQEQLKYY